MQTKSKLGGIKERIFIHRMLGVSIASFAVFLMAFILVPTLISEASATTASVGAAWNTVSLSFDPDVAATSSATDPTAEQALPTHGDVLFGDIVPTSTDENTGNLGTMRVIKKTLGVETAGQYYSVYLSMSGDSNRLLLNNTNMYIEPTNGTWNSPTAFTGSSWGYAVPTGNATSGTFITPFSTHAVYNNYDSLLGRDLTKTGTGSSVYNTGLWAAIPVNDTDVAPQQIWKAETSNTNGFGGELGDDVKDHFDIYFATIIDTNVMAGTYSNSIVYTAIASSTSLDSASTNLSRSLEYVGENSEEVLSFDLSASTSTITQDQVKVYLVPHYIVEHSNYTITSDYAAYKTAANTCTVTNLTITSAGATATCTLPASPNGIDDGITAEDTVTYELDDGEGGTTTETVTIEKGEFDLWLNIEDYGYDYLSRYTKELDPIASIVYAGLQSTDKNGNAYITEMQEMKGYICDQTNEWGTTLGAAAELYNYEGMNADTPVNLATGATADTLGLGTFALKDNRDDKDYLVRRLADGNCWMVQNLDLELADFIGKDNTNGGLTPENTDISGRLYYDPSERAATRALASDPTIDIIDQTSYFPVYSQHWLNQTQEKQFLSYNLSYNLGSPCTAADECNQSHRTFEGSRIARSYSNMVTDNQSIDFSHATGFRYIATNWQTGYSRNQSTDEEAPTSFDESATTPVTATESYIPTERASSSTGSAGAEYENNATGTYYGNMYIGHYYNIYAASAEYRNDIGSVSTTIAQTICPSGWHIPGINGEQSWGGLLSIYSMISSSETTANASTLGLRMLPISLVFGGSGQKYNTSALEGRGRDVLYHTNMVATQMGRFLYITTASLNIAYRNNYAVNNGATIRCVARD